MGSVKPDGLRWTRASTGAVLALVLVAAPLGAQGAHADELPTTTGAAPGYVPDRACADCHEELWESYQHVGMARAFERARPDAMIADLEDAHFFHEASGNHYEVVVRGEEVFQRRYRLDPDGEEYAVLERKLDWIVGSGNHCRNYFFRTELGEMYQLPLVWYTQEGHWGMAPGYDQRDHYDFTRRVGRECMSCHNAYPDVPAGSDLFGQPDLFPPELPEGIGCQRCHGPGAEHVRLAESAAPDAAVRAAITNPRDLSPEASEALCNQCHLQPVATIEGFVQRFDVGTYAFRPGMLLEELRIPVDVDQERDPTDHFEINHHAYRLAQSTCFIESDGALSCLTCHDPHRKVPPVERASYYRAKCVSCHGPEVCSQMPMHASRADVAPDDCVTCHMPERRPREVVNVTMTDHRIRRHLPPPQWKAERPEREWAVPHAAVHRPEALAGDPDGSVYAALASANSGSPDAIRALAEELEASRPDSVQAWLSLGEKLFLMEEPEEAEAAYRRAVELAPDLALAHHRLGATLGMLGRRDEALASLERALELDPRLPEVHLVLALLHTADGELERAIPCLERAIELRPHQFEPRLQLANLYTRLGKWKQAVAGYRGARRADPRQASAHDNLGLALRMRGKWSAALRAWRLGLDCVPGDPSMERRVAELLLTAPDAELRDPALALEHAARAVVAAPENECAALVHALALLESGNPHDAFVEAVRAGELGALDASWRLLAARAARETGRAVHARRLLAQASDAAAPTLSDPVHRFIREHYGSTRPAPRSNSVQSAGGR